MVKYNIISTGSDGNATILEDFVLVDCGVPYKALEPYVPKLKLVLLTHIRAYGKHYAYATDINGNRQYLEFTRVNDVYLLLSVTVTSSGGLDDDYAARIKSLLMEEILSAGTTIRLQTFIRPIMESVSGVDYVEIRGLLSEKPDIEGVADNSMLTGIVPVEINQQPVLSMSGIRVVKA